MVRMSYVCISKGPSGSRSCLAIIGVDHDSILRLVRKLGEVQRTGHRMPRLNGSGNTKISTKCGSLAPVFIRFLCQQKIAQVARKVPSFLQRRELLPLTFVHGTGRMRRRDRLLFIEQPQLASTPFTRHRETGERHTTVRKPSLVIPHPVLYAFNRSKEYLSHTLCGINCGRKLSRHMHT